jgi:hypothetical protein
MLGNSFNFWELLILVLLKTKEQLVPWIFKKKSSLRELAKVLNFQVSLLERKKLQIKCHIVFPSIISVFVDSILKGET